MKKSIVILFLLLSTFVYSQKSYKEYYTLIDSAKYYTYAEMNYAYADSLYKIVFSNFAPFAYDVNAAIFNYYKIDSVLNNEYVALAIKQGELYRNIKFRLDRNKIYYNKRELKKISRKAKRSRDLDKNRKFRRKIRHLLIRDMYARRRSKDYGKADSINAIKLKEFLKKDSTIFSRHQLGDTYTDLLQILLYHQGWEYWNGKDFEFLIDLVDKGHLKRDVTAEIIERESVSSGIIFTIKNNKIYTKEKELGKDSISRKYYYSSTGKRVLPKNGKYYATPLFPELSIEEVDSLRSYLFYPPLSLFKSTNPHILYLPVNEYFEVLYVKK